MRESNTTAIRDELAKIYRWERQPLAESSFISSPCWAKKIRGGGIDERNDHPIADTLDEADDLMPNGWKWSYAGIWTGWPSDNRDCILVPDTGDKKLDLFTLVLLCERSNIEKREARPPDADIIIITK